ncbi:OmpA family protein [Burkholderia cepacia]|uniref:OmpA family protein n=2 Tax=Burkholderia cepacia TaxID=292 RepID=A0A2S8I9I0_BURCE|nr:OmpA family protein [Burkholderia cepacia]HDR9511022.1 OmpA family protein [Burkholderia cepacia]
MSGLLTIATLLAGCGTASGPTYNAYAVQLPGGAQGFHVTCYGLFQGEGVCQRKAQEMCQSKAVRSVDLAPMGVAPNPREMWFQCGQPPVAVASEPAPQMTPVPPPPPPPARALTLSGDATFQTGKANLTAEAQDRLDQVAEQARGTQFRTVVVKGYTDSTGSAGLNQRLSERRAQAVAGYLRSHGLQASNFSATGYGAANPVASNATAAGRAQNRRVEVLLSQ